jgi:hypothetical protein
MDAPNSKHASPIWELVSAMTAATNHGREKMAVNALSRLSTFRSLGRWRFTVQFPFAQDALRVLDRSFLRNQGSRCQSPQAAEQ